VLIPVVTASKLGDSPTLFVFSEGISASKPMLMVNGCYTIKDVVVYHNPFRDTLFTSVHHLSSSCESCDAQCHNDSTTAQVEIL
jgi:hypothetical protein